MFSHSNLRANSTLHAYPRTLQLCDNRERFGHRQHLSGSLLLSSRKNVSNETSATLHHLMCHENFANLHESKDAGSTQCPLTCRVRTHHPQVWSPRARLRCRPGRDSRGRGGEGPPAGGAAAREVAHLARGGARRAAQLRREAPAVLHAPANSAPRSGSHPYQDESQTKRAGVKFSQ